MVKAPSKVTLFIVMVIAIAFMAFANNYSYNHRAKTNEELEAEEHDQQAATRAKAPDGQLQRAPKPVATGAINGRMASGNSGNVTAGGTNGLVALGEDSVVGAKSTSAPEITVRWSWTPDVQAHPARVLNAIDAITKQFPSARVHVVNTDESGGTPDGVFVAGKLITPVGPDGEITVQPQELKGAIGQK